MQYMAACPSLCYQLPPLDVPRAPRTTFCGPRDLGAQLAYGLPPPVSNIFVAPAPCTLPTVPLLCPIFRPTAAGVRLYWIV